MKQRKTYKRQGIIGIKYPDDKYYHKIYATTDVINRKANLKWQYTNCEITVFKDYENRVTKKELKEEFNNIKSQYCKQEIVPLEYSDKDTNYLYKLVRTKQTKKILDLLSKSITFHPITNKSTYHNIFYNRNNNKFYKLAFDKEHNPITSNIFYKNDGEELSIHEVVEIIKRIKNLKRRYTQMKHKLNDPNYIYNSITDSFKKTVNNNKSNNNKSVIVTGNNNTTTTTTINNFYNDDNVLADKLLVAFSELFNMDKNKIRECFIPFDEQTIRHAIRNILKKNNLEVLKIW